MCSASPINKRLIQRAHYRRRKRWSVVDRGGHPEMQCSPPTLEEAAPREGSKRRRCDAAAVTIEATVVVMLEAAATVTLEAATTLALV